MVNSKTAPTNEQAYEAATETVGLDGLVPLTTDNFSMKDYRNVYRAIMTAEEAICQAGNDAANENDHTPSSKYLFGLQEFLSAERGKLISALRDHPMDTEHANNERICMLIEFEAWCQEFNKETLALLMGSKLARDAY